AAHGGYLEALKKGQFAEAGGFLDPKSFLSQVEPLMHGFEPDSGASDSAPDPARTAETMRKVFGVSTRDQLAGSSMGANFASLMGYLETQHPGSTAQIARADFKVLEARRLGEKVHVAYELSLPPEKAGEPPMSYVTAEQLHKVNGRWLIL